MGLKSRTFLIISLLTLEKMGKASVSFPPIRRSSWLSVFECCEDIVEQEAMASLEIAKGKKRARGHKKKSIV